MLRRPDVDEVMEYSRTLGLELTSTEARIMQARMGDHIAMFEAFQEMDIEEQCLPLKYTNRDRGYRPTEQEDPLHAFITKCHIEGAERGPLKGKAIGLKDHVAVAGIPLTFGSHFMDGYIPDFDATIVTKVLDAGGTIVGKMNMDQFSSGGPGFGGQGDYGRPLNPHDPRRMTGGSSSGSGAAVAAGYVDIAFGGDQGGSIRVPAAWCGAVGIKATFGLIPHTGVFGNAPTIDYVGPIARTVEDVATILDCVAGPDGYDPRQVGLPMELPNYTEALTRGVDGLRIGILLEGIEFDGIEPDVKEAILEAVGVLERAGAHVEKVSVPLHEKASLPLIPVLIEEQVRLLDTNFAGAFAKSYYPTSLITTFGRFKQSHAHELPLNNKLNLILGTYLQRHYHGRFYAKAQNVRPFFVKQYNEAFERVDILAMPTVPFKAPTYKEPGGHEEAIERTLLWSELEVDVSLLIRNPSPFNLTGHPAISLPCAKSGGLPISLMLVAPHFRDDWLVRAAYAYEHSVDWATLIACPPWPVQQDKPAI